MVPDSSTLTAGDSSKHDTVIILLFSTLLSFLSPFIEISCLNQQNQTLATFKSWLELSVNKDCFLPCNIWTQIFFNCKEKTFSFLLAVITQKSMSLESWFLFWTYLHNCTIFHGNLLIAVKICHLNLLSELLNPPNCPVGFFYKISHKVGNS